MNYHIGKEKIEWVKQPVPKFIQQFKERTNQIEKPTLDSKSSKSNVDEDLEKADETPLICVAGGVSEEEIKAFMKESYGDEAEVRLESSDKKRTHGKEGEEDDNEGDDGGKVQFKKPNKEEKKGKEKKKSKMKKVKNASLLSFGDDEEEEEE